MVYSIAWDETDPDGTENADTIDTEIINVKVSIRERLEDLIPDWATDGVDPKVFKFAGTFAKGTVAAPIAPATDPNTGFFWNDDDTISVSIAGVKKAEFYSAGLKVDVLAELTAAAGVTIDGVLLKDSLIGAAYGGTGRASPTTGNILLGAGASAMTLLAPGAAGGYIRSNGTTFVRTSGVAAADVQAGSFATGNFVITGNLTVTGTVTAAAFTE